MSFSLNSILFKEKCASCRKKLNDTMGLMNETMLCVSCYSAMKHSTLNRQINTLYSFRLIKNYRTVEEFNFIPTIEFIDNLKKKDKELELEYIELGKKMLEIQKEMKTIQLTIFNIDSHNEDILQIMNDRTDSNDQIFCAITKKGSIALTSLKEYANVPSRKIGTVINTRHSGNKLFKKSKPITIQNKIQADDDEYIFGSPYTPLSSSPSPSCSSSSPCSCLANPSKLEIRGKKKGKYRRKYKRPHLRSSVINGWNPFSATNKY